MNRIIFISDSASNNKQNYIKSVFPYMKDKFLASDSKNSIQSVEESNDVTELIINQILSTAIHNIYADNIYVINSNNLYIKNRAYSAKTVRYFVNKRKECGDIFLFVGNNKISRLVAKSWGFT